MASTLLLQKLGAQIATEGDRLIKLLETLTPEQLWAPGPGGSNPIGNLALHLAGNLRHFLGAGLLKDGYVRDRPGEFAARGVAKETVLAKLRAGIEVARRAYAAVQPDALDDAQAELLARLPAHFAYHAGQASYAARALGVKP